MKKLGFLGFFIVFILQSKAVIKLNQPIASGESVTSGRFANGNNKRVVFIADPTGSAIDRLFSVDYTLGPNSITNLNGSLALGGSVFNFRISPDGNHVVFRADKDIQSVFELYSVPTIGGNVTKLNSQLVSNGDVLNFQISTNNARVVYLADQDSDTTNELYSVLITGGAVTKLNSPLVANGDVSSFFQISPDSTHVVYTADQDTDGVNEIYSAQIAATGSTKLNNPLVFNGNVLFIGGFKISPDSARVVYLADQDSDTTNELYSVLITGGAVTKLNSPLVANGDVSSLFKISSDSTRVVYLANQDDVGVDEIYSSLIGGGGNVKLNNPLVPNGDVENNFHISPDSSRVVYVADQDIDQSEDLFSATLAGTSIIKLNSSTVSNVEYTSLEISPDSARVVYKATMGFGTGFQYFSSLIDTTGSTKIESGVVDQLTDQQINPDSSQVIYYSFKEGPFQLYRSPITGGSSAKVNGPLPLNGFITLLEPILIHPSGNPLIYHAAQDDTNKIELYVTAIRPPVITSPLIANSIIGASSFNYTITATNEPITSYGASGLPSWATLNNNVISGVPDKVGVFPITLSVTNDAGIDTKFLNLAVNQSNVVIVVPSATGFTGDFDGDGTLDLVAQKKATATLIAFKTSGIDTSKKVTLNKKDKIVGANIVNSNNALIVQNKIAISAIIISNNFTTGGNVNLGNVANPKIKAVASGEINGDGLADIITQQGKTIGALLSPSYSSVTLVNTKKSSPKVVGVLARIGNTSNAVSSLVLVKGKKLFFYDIPTNSPFVVGEANEPQVGPSFDKKYKVVGAVAGTNAATVKLIITKGKNIGIVSYGSNSLGTPVFKTTKKLGKVVAPQ